MISKLPKAIQTCLFHSFKAQVTNWNLERFCPFYWKQLVTFPLFVHHVTISDSFFTKSGHFMLVFSLAAQLSIFLVKENQWCCTSSRTHCWGKEREAEKPCTWQESNPWPQEFFFVETCSTAELQPLPLQFQIVASRSNHIVHNLPPSLGGTIPPSWVRFSWA